MGPPHAGCPRGQLSQGARWFQTCIVSPGNVLIQAVLRARGPALGPLVPLSAKIPGLRLRFQEFPSGPGASPPATRRQSVCSPKTTLRRFQPIEACLLNFRRPRHAGTELKGTSPSAPRQGLSGTYPTPPASPPCIRPAGGRQHHLETLDHQLPEKRPVRRALSSPAPPLNASLPASAAPRAPLRPGWLTGKLVGPRQHFVRKCASPQAGSGLASCPCSCTATPTA